ncbi:MAG: SDR family oxidoreductase [Actinomycetales bacterium]|nr:SDR family oxidoreductase [Actinomycetales bacterium]
MKLNGKVVVITGAGNGMGREMTLEALRRGARVFGIDLKAESLAETAKLAEAGDNFKSKAMDITDRSQCASLPAEVVAAMGQVDVIVNNAGIIQPFVFVEALDFEHIDRVMNVNFNGPLNLIKAFLPELKKRPEAQIVNVSSMGGYGPVPGQSVYGASKAALKLLTEALRAELTPTKVHVTGIYPGAIGTNIAANSGIKMDLPSGTDAPKMKMTPAPLAGKIMIDGIEANKARVFVGSDAAIMDKLVRLMPVKSGEIIYNQMKSILPH